MPVFKKLSVRFILGYPAWMMLFYSVNVLPIGLSSTINNLTPFFTLIMAYLLLKEKLKKVENFNMIASFIGVLIIVSFSNKQESASAHVVSDFEFLFCIFLNVLSAFLVGTVNVIIRSLKDVHFAVAAGF
jgi:drug/metabolite transporter (DMT)-like permease